MKFLRSLKIFNIFIKNVNDRVERAPLKSAVWITANWKIILMPKKEQPPFRET